MNPVVIDTNCLLQIILCRRTATSECSTTRLSHN